MRLLVTAFCFILHFASSAQEELQEQSKKIEIEGKKLYRSEMASWHGTDIFLEKFPQHRNNFSAYFSYEDANGIHCIFYSKGDQPKVLATISFDESYDLTKATANGTPRELTVFETDMHGLRNAALGVIQTDSFFRHYKNTNLNVVPMIEKEVKKVYVLTGTSQGGVVMFGNDYLLTFDKDNRLLTKKALHRSLIPIQYGGKEDAEAFGAMHTHLPELGELMTATDICTLMLYQHLTKWKQHIVVSEKYISIWSAAENKLLTLTREAWEKIQGSKR